MGQVRLSEMMRLTFFSASLRLFYLLKCETKVYLYYLAKIPDSEMLASTQTCIFERTIHPSIIYPFLNGPLEH